MDQEEDLTLRRLVEGPKQNPGASCPAPEEWASLVAGLLTRDRRETLLDHAAACDACGPVLREVAGDLDNEITGEEAEVVASLRTATLGGQRDLARRIAKESRHPPSSWVKWMGRAAAVIVCAAGSWIAFDYWRTSEPEQLIAQAYTERRPFEYRMRDAAHGPVRAERGVGSRLDRPETLLAAEAKIASELKSQPDSTRWLRLRALTEMLDRNSEEAIATLRRALDSREDDPRLLADLGMAYALRAESPDRTADYSSAIEYLSRALRADPRDAATLFNRAVVYERMLMYTEAAEDWRRYIEVDPQGGWAEEARHRLREIEQKKKLDARP